MSGPGPSPYPPVASPVRTRVDLSMNALTSSPSTSSPSAPPRQSSPRTIAAPTYPYLQNTYPPVQQQQHQLPSIQYPPSLAASPLHDLRPNYHQYGQDSAGGGLPPLSAATTHHVPQQHQHHQMSAGGSPYQQQQQFHYPPTGMFTPPTTTTAPYSPKPIAQQQRPPQPTSQQKQPSPTPAPANQIPPGGAPARRYLNDNVTPVLLEGMKMLAREQPKEPLLALARFLEERHREEMQRGEKKGGDVKMEDAANGGGD